MSDETTRGEMPTVAESLVADGWALSEQTSETVFKLSAASITGHTRVYEDERLRTVVREATDGELDRTWRFFFAMRLSFSPSLPPGVGPMAVFGTVASEADKTFVSDLQERGFRDVSKSRRERIRVDSSDRARLRTYSATVDVDIPGEGVRPLDTAGFMAVWTTDGSFRLAGGAYPRTPLDEFLDVEDERLATDPQGFREELLDLIRGVQ
jgi:hypothetical protein